MAPQRMRAQLYKESSTMRYAHNISSYICGRGLSTVSIATIIAVVLGRSSHHTVMLKNGIHATAVDTRCTCRMEYATAAVGAKDYLGHRDGQSQDPVSQEPRVSALLKNGKEACQSVGDVHPSQQSVDT